MQQKQHHIHYVCVLSTKFGHLAADVFDLLQLCVFFQGSMQRESDCTCHNRVALGHTGGEVGAGAVGKARLHVFDASVQGWERVLIRLQTNTQQMQKYVNGKIHT